MRLAYEARRLGDVVRALIGWRILARHDRWSRAEVHEHQRSRLAALVRHAAANSPFYRDLYRNLELGGPVALAALPRIDKRAVMENFDRVVTDPRLRLSALEDHLRALRRDEYHLGEYRVLATAGTSGFRGIFVFNRREWAVELANALRWHALMGLTPRILPRVRISAIGADGPIHISARLTESGDVGVFRFQLLDVSAPIGSLSAALEHFQPEVLLAYPSVAALLALEQLDGRLAIAPRTVSTHSELLTGEMARHIERAWGTRPFNHYGLTELSTFGAECARHRGLHMLDDLFIAEILDDDYRPVRPGQLGRRLLLTNLYNYTQPLIRYEVSDMLALSPDPCPCGRPFPLVSTIGGRSEETIELAGPDGRRVLVPPLVFPAALEGFPEIVEFQVRKSADGIQIRIVPRPFAGEDLERAVAERIGARLGELGAVPPPIRVERVAKLARRSGRMGKVRLVGD
jgi:phenylacetate-CoA ligase